MTDTSSPADVPAEAVPTATTTAAPAEPAPKTEAQDESAAPTTTEPQNALTQKFTEAEWAALKELKVCFYPILVEA